VETLARVSVRPLRHRLEASRWVARNHPGHFMALYGKLPKVWDRSLLSLENLSGPEDEGQGGVEAN
jgi:hypothetical protein